MLFGSIYPDVIVETRNGNSKLVKAAGKITDDGNQYYIIVDTAMDNPNVFREMKVLKDNISGKNNVSIINIHSFEFLLLSFELLEKWVFSETDELKDKRKDLLEARKQFVKLITKGGSSDDLNSFKTVFKYQYTDNSEKIANKLLEEITKNTGFATTKSNIGPCFINSCCDWNNRQEDDICGLDDNRLSVEAKMKEILARSVLQGEFTKVGL